MGEIDVRSKIQQIVSSLSAIDEQEQAHISFVLEWLKSGKEIFRLEKPATPDMHLVSYFLITNESMDEVLLVDHKKAELWLPPGGHVDPGEHPKETVKREAMEELGIVAEFLVDEPIFITVTKTVGNVTEHTDVSLWYLLKGNPEEVLKFDIEEFHQIRWFGIEEIPFEKSDPHLKRFIQKMLNLNVINSKNISV